MEVLPVFSNIDDNLMFSCMHSCTHSHDLRTKYNL